MTNKEFADSLRQIADFYDEHEDFPLPHLTALDIFGVHDGDELARVVRALGHVEKSTIGPDLFAVTRMFGAYGLKVVVDRSIACVRRVVGTEAVAERVIPAHVREIVEWDCHPLLAATAEETEAAA